MFLFGPFTKIDFQLRIIYVQSGHYFYAQNSWGAKKHIRLTGFGDWRGCKKVVYEGEEEERFCEVFGNNPSNDYLKLWTWSSSNFRFSPLIHFKSNFYNSNVRINWFWITKTYIKVSSYHYSILTSTRKRIFGEGLSSEVAICWMHIALSQKRLNLLKYIKPLHSNSRPSVNEEFRYCFAQHSDGKLCIILWSAVIKLFWFLVKYKGKDIPELGIKMEFFNANTTLRFEYCWDFCVLVRVKLLMRKKCRLHNYRTIALAYYSIPIEKWCTFHHRNCGPEQKC